MTGTTTVRITADRERCIGSGMCVYAEPGIFDQREDGRVVVLEDRPDPRHTPAVRAAIAQCPVSALRLDAENAHPDPADPHSG